MTKKKKENKVISKRQVNILEEGKIKTLDLPQMTREQSIEYGYAFEKVVHNLNELDLISREYRGGEIVLAIFPTKAFPLSKCVALEKMIEDQREDHPWLGTYHGYMIIEGDMNSGTYKQLKEQAFSNNRGIIAFINDNDNI